MQPKATLYVGVAAPLIEDLGRPIPPIDHRRYLRELKEALEGQPVRLVARVGLTRQAFRGDLLRLRPELVALFCHGTEDGHLLLENGRGRAVLVPGEELLPALKPRPVATFVAACHSQAAVERAGINWDEAALIAIDPETPVEVAACAQFQSYFYSALLAGRSAGEAFGDAVEFVAGSDTVGDRAFVAEAVPASRKFRLLAGHGVQLSEVATGELLAVAHDPMPVPHVRSAEMRRGADRFVGRQREVAEVIDALLPLAAGRRAPGRGDRRCVTLTKEGGIGKTALAVEVAEWVRERECFAGVLEVSCEEMRLPGQLPARLLKLLGLPEAEQKGDLVELLCEVVRERVGDGSVLLVVDNLDDLVATTAPQELRSETRAVIENLLGVAPQLRVLATCRWPIGLAEDERLISVLPLNEDDARDVFLSHLEKPEHVCEVRGTWDQERSPARRLIGLSGRHPQSLRLLARQLRRPGLSLERLCAEAHENLLGKLVDPYAADDEDDRRYKVARSYELSYRHLSDAARQLFARLARFPSGIWCGDFPEQMIGWHEVLGDQWKELIERELDLFALVHFEDDRSGPGAGFYRMLPSMLELARQKLSEYEENSWHEVWVEFWQQRLSTWNEMLKGKAPEELVGSSDAGRAGETRRQEAISLFRANQASWLDIFDFARQQDPFFAKWLLLDLIPYTDWVGHRVLGMELAVAAVSALRPINSGADLAACLVVLGKAQRDLGEWQMAVASHGEALEIYRRLATTDPAIFDAEIALTLNNLGAVQRDLDDQKASAVSFEEALEIYRRLASKQPSTFDAEVAMTLTNLGPVQRVLGHQAMAVGSYCEALEIFQRLAKKHPAAFDTHVAVTLNNLGSVKSALGEWEAAQTFFEEALDIYRRLAMKHPAAVEAELAMTLNNLGGVKSDRGMWNAAETLFIEALEVYRNLALKYSPAFEAGLAITLNNLAHVKSNLGESGTAVVACREALEIYRRLASRHPTTFDPGIAMSLNSLGSVQRDLGEWEAAAVSYGEALEIQRRLAARHPAAFDADVAMTLNNLGNVQSDLGEREAAAVSYTEALQIYAPLVAKYPSAYGQNRFIVLRNYTLVAPETPDDPWWQLWYQLNPPKDG